MNALKSHDSCPKCGDGRLEQKLAQEGDAPSDMRKIRLGQIYKTWWIVAKLECGSCDATFTAPNEGKQVERDLIEPQLATFTNPPENPTVCSHCDSDEIWRGVKQNPAITARCMAGPKIPDYPGDVPYRFCANCLNLAWVFPTVPEHGEETND